MSVSREKYNALKAKAEKWRQLANECKEHLEELEAECESLNQRCQSLDKKCVLLELQVNESNDNHRRKAREQEEEFIKENFDLRKELMLKDGKVQQLTDALASQKQRYQDLYEEYRELRRSTKA